MPSVDVVSRLDMQEIDNAVNAVKKEIANRFDFRNSKTEIELIKHEKRIRLLIEDDMKLRAVKEMLVGRLIGRKVFPKILDFGQEEKAASGMLRVEIRLREGLTADDARVILKITKESKLKVQAAIQGDQVRLSGNKIDDLQAIMQLARANESITVPLQFINMKR
ncbi:MAG: YajQ family cyclic di-GMP-binding protein [bacterium]|nr:YajQ family cyclic di-GMP-binding protein [Candidatus Sumerlaeota bacterium]